MENFNQTHSKGLDQSIMDWLSDHSATILLIAAIASFFITGLVEFFHYKEVFGKALEHELALAIAILFALFFQGVRCATIANSAKQFRQGEKAKGVFILVVSLAVTIFCTYEAGQIAEIWEKGHTEIAGYIHAGILCVVWAGWVLELILVVSVAGTLASTPPAMKEWFESEMAKLQAEIQSTNGELLKARKDAQKAFNQLQSQIPMELDPSMNGNGAAH